LNISVFELLKNRNLGHKSLDKLIDYIEEHGHKIKTHEGK
jgi:hypothetical protein